MKVERLTNSFLSVTIRFDSSLLKTSPSSNSLTAKVRGWTGDGSKYVTYRCCVGYSIGVIISSNYYELPGTHAGSSKEGRTLFHILPSSSRFALLFRMYVHKGVPNNYLIE